MSRYYLPLLAVFTLLSLACAAGNPVSQPAAQDKSNLSPKDSAKDKKGVTDKEGGKDTPEFAVPKIELTADLKELGIEFSDWKATDKRTIEGIVRPTKKPLERTSSFIGRELRMTVYDEKGLKAAGSGGSLLYPDLQPGEKGNIRITINEPLKLDKVSRIVLDKK